MNEFEEEELDIELEESSLEVVVPDEVHNNLNSKYMKNDPLNREANILAVEARGTALPLGQGNAKLGLEAPTQEPFIMLNVPEDFEIDDIELDEESGLLLLGDGYTEIEDVEIEDDNQFALAISNPGANQLAVKTFIKDRLDNLYPQDENELLLITEHAKLVHDSIYKPTQYRERMLRQVTSYLNTHKFNLFSKTLKFEVDEMKDLGDFRTLMKSQFVRVINGSQSYESVFEVMKRAYGIAMKIPELDEELEATIEELVADYLRYGLVRNEAATLKHEETRYKPQYESVKMPTLVSNFEYQCECGGKARMPNNRPVLCFLARGGAQDSTLLIMNEPVQCGECGDWLALSSALAEAIQYNANAYFKGFPRYKEFRIYRPKIEITKNFIPSDAQDLFQLDVANIVETSIHDDSKVSMVGVNYKRLIGIWMKNQESSYVIKEASDQFTNLPIEQQLVTSMAYGNFNNVPELEAYQFTKTVIHYLENFSLFAITPERKMLYEMYQKEELNKVPFSDEYAVKWITDNAHHIAGLNNIFVGDMDTKSLVILPKYHKAINKALMLHLMSDQSKLATGEELAKWLNNPSGETSLNKKVAKIISGKDYVSPDSNFGLNTKLIDDKRGFRDSGITHPLEAWSDLYHMLKAIGKQILETNAATPHETTLINEALRKTRSEFYGLTEDKKLIVQETLMKDDFEHFFKKYGFMLFTGLMLDEKRRNLAMYISLMEFSTKGRESLGVMFAKSETANVDVSKVLWSTGYSPSYSKEESEEIKLRIVLESIDLPSTLNDTREQFGVQTILDNLDEFKDLFINDEEFMNKYGGEFTCFS